MTSASSTDPTLTNVWLELETDPDLEDPSQFDQTWVIHSFNRRHSNFKHPDTLKVAANRFSAGTAFWLSWHGHGNELWWRANAEVQGPQCQFDTVKYAGIALWNHGTKLFRDNRLFTYEQRGENLDLFLSQYNAWSNGEGWCWQISDEEHRVLESCGGYYSEHDAMQAMIESILPTQNVNTGALAIDQRKLYDELVRQT